jgi:hypothetical protein
MSSSPRVVSEPVAACPRLTPLRRHSFGMTWPSAEVAVCCLRFCGGNFPGMRLAPAVRHWASLIPEAGVAWP